MIEVKIGDLVVLLEMKDIQAPPKGTTGIVQHIDDAKQIHVHWTTGSSLALIPKLDKFDIIKIKYHISNENLEIFKSDLSNGKNDFFYGAIPILEVIDIYNSNQNFFESIWSVAKRNRITSEQFYKANYHCYNNTDETFETLLTEVIKEIEKKNIDRWFSYPDSKHFVWMAYNQEEHKYYRVIFDYSELQTELYLSGPNLLYTSLSFELTSDKTTVYSNSNLIDGYNTLHNNAYAITDINDKDIEIIYEKLVSNLVYHGYRYLVLTTSDAFEYDFIIYDIQTNEYAEKENGEYYLFEDEDSANKCCEELNRTGVK